MEAIWKLVPPLIKPFYIDETIDWESKSLETNPVSMEFKDEEVAGQYRRFAHRDLIMALIAVMSLSGNLLYPLLGLAYGRNLCEIPLYTTFALNFVVDPLEIGLHLFFENTVRFATCRRYLAIIIVSLATFPTCLCAFNSIYLNCEKLTYPFRSWGLNDPNFTEQRVEWYCRNIIGAFPVMSVTNVLISLPLPPVLALIPIVIDWTGEYIARPLGAGYSSHPETTRELAVKTVVLVSISMMTYVLMTLRHRGMLNQFRSTVQLAIEKKRALKREEDLDTLLCAMIPTSALLRLSSHEPVEDWTEEATVLFSDMVQFTAWSSKRTPQEVVSMLNRLCISIDQLAVAKKVEKIKTIGDAYWAVCGLPDIVDDHAERMCDFGNGMLDQLATLNSRHSEWGNVQLRIGIHSGPLAGGILGTRQLSYEVFGETSHLAEEVEKAGRASKVTISAATLEFLRLEPTDVEAHGSMDIGGGKTVPLFVIFRSTVEAFKVKLLEREAGGASSTATVSRHHSFLSRRSRHSSELQSHSSRGSLGPATAEEAKRRRQQFLAERATYQQGTPSITLEALNESYSKRKYNWVFFTFADPTVESEFMTFVEERQHRVRVATRGMTLLLIGLVLMGAWIEGGRFSLASTVLFPICVTSALVDLLLCLFGTSLRIPSWVSAVTHHSTVILLWIAAGLMPKGSSATTNEITYLHSVCTMLLGAGNVAIIPSATLFFAGISLVPLLVFLLWDAVQIFTSTLFFAQSNIIILFNLIVMERHLRQQFLEYHVGLFLQGEQSKRNQEQQALLKAIVPAHVVDELMVWLSTDLDPRLSIVRSYPHVVCCFAKLSPMEIASCGASLIDATDPEVKVVAVRHEQDWLAPAQIAVDALLDHFPAINKIKTVGDILMLAGSFVDQYTPEVAAQQMLQAVWQLKTTISPKLQAGMHVGEIVGGVLGTNRLCFDIFGDTVNVTSRAMTGGEAGQIMATMPYIALLSSRQRLVLLAEESSSALEMMEPDAARPVFGPIKDLLAKGKGTIQVRGLLFVPLLNLSSFCSDLERSDNSPETAPAWFSPLLEEADTVEHQKCTPTPIG